MNIDDTIRALEKKGYQVSCFDARQQAIDYLKKSIHGKTIGFGGSQTLTELDLRHVLAEDNTVYVPDFAPEGENFVTVSQKAMTADVFLLSAKEYDFNFSHLHLMVKTTFSFEEHEEEVVWHVRQETIHAVMETEVHCLKKDMLLINYEAPDGSRRHRRLWNGGNGWGTVKLYDKKNGHLEPVDEIEATHIGCEYGEYDHEEAY